MSRAHAACEDLQTTDCRARRATEPGERCYRTVDDVFEALYRDEIDAVDAAHELELLQKHRYPFPVRVIDFLSR